MKEMKKGFTIVEVSILFVIFIIVAFLVFVTNVIYLLHEGIPRLV